MLINLKDYIKTIESGKRPKGGAIESGIPSLGGEHIDNFGGLIISDSKMKYVPQDYYEKLNKGIIKKNDILVVKDGATTGKVAIVDEKFTLPEACINEHLFILRPKEQIKPKFLFYYFFSEVGKKEILKDFRGATVGGISKEFIDINLDIPSKDNQEKIIKVLDVAKNIIDKRKAQIEALDELVKSQFIEMFGDPITNSFDNKTKQLKEVAKLERGKFTPRPRNDPKYFNGEFPFIQTGDISRSNHRLSNYSSTLNEEGIKVSKKFDSGTVVIALVGATIGMTAILEREVYATDSIVGITVYDNVIDNIFLEMLLRAWREPLLDMAPEAARANINIGILEKLPIILPDIKEQKKFASFVKQVDKLKFEMEKSLKDLEDNFNSLMQKAFNGQLFNK
ncbi:MAG: restriction endonuclease subunit S [Clostridium butyricum]|nr:restriction endonuclease subunit S [Clostridium butyricum]MDU6038679.1 restriction endonuclease subunit S [Clostridium butyricum]